MDPQTPQTPDPGVGTPDPVATPPADPGVGSPAPDPGVDTPAPSEEPKPEGDMPGGDTTPPAPAV